MNRNDLRVGDSRGAVIIWVTLLMVVFLGFAALAVDLGYLLVTRNELQNVSDATSLAGTRVLGLEREGLTPAQQQSYVADPATILDAVQDVANRNRAGGVEITINESDVTIGRWNAQTRTLSPTLSQADAVRVVARRDESANDPVPTFFARILGEESADVSALATAALTGQVVAGEGGLPVPFGIARAWFDPNFEFCDQPIRFYPANDPSSCAGWHVYDQWPSNDQRLRTTIAGLETGGYTSPETIAGETSFSFIGGTMSQQTFDAMLSLYEANRDPDTGEWEVTVPVYALDDCSNPNQTIPIVGFATAIISGVQSSPVHQIDGIVICDMVEPSRGGGTNYGTLGSIPGLVQ